MAEAKRTIGFVCPECHSSVVVERTVFSLTAAPTVIPCPCGKSRLMTEYFGDRFQITAPCAACGGTHQVDCPSKTFLNSKALAFACKKTGLDCCYVGEEGEVYAALRHLEEAADQLKQAGEQKNAFLNELVMEEVLEELKEIAGRGGISCACGSKRWSMKVDYSSVELICADCGQAMRINAATMDDLNELCCHPKLTIRGGR